MALENVNLIIEPGEKVVVAGRTGRYVVLNLSSLELY